MVLFWVFNATGSLPLALVAWLLPGILFAAMNEGPTFEPPTRVLIGPSWRGLSEKHLKRILVIRRD